MIIMIYNVFFLLNIQNINNLCTYINDLHNTYVLCGPLTSSTLQLPFKTYTLHDVAL